LQAISRLIPVEPGSKMTYMGDDLLEYPPDKVVSKLGISHVPEGRRLFENLTVMENLKLACYARKDGKQIERDMERVFAIFPRLEERKSQKSGTMSGGEQQMLAVGRALLSARKVMLLDEPSMGLAPLLMKDVFNALKEINQEGTTILLVEQNARMALQFSQRGYVLESGNLALEGDSAELLTNPEVKKATMIVVTRGVGGRGRAVGTDVPSQVEQVPAVEAGLLEDGVAIRANLPVLFDFAAAARADHSLLQVLQQRLFFQRALIDLGQRLARAQQEV
jgi:branched-chain amino acid transport system ATP-binding protein